jgi:hypothetical protein
MYTPLWIEKPRIIKCWNCGKLLWIEDLQEYAGEKDSWYETDRKQTTGFKINPDKPMWKDYDKLTQDDYHYMLQEKLFQGTLNEEVVRQQAFWARNDKCRNLVGCYSYPVYNPEDKSVTIVEVCPEVKDPNVGNLEYATVREIENMEAMLATILAANNGESKFLHVELLRELGRFEEALLVLGTIPVEESGGDIFVKAQRGYCSEKCTCVREVEFP